jgi:hypothetical protein
LLLPWYNSDVFAGDFASCLGIILMFFPVILLSALEMFDMFFDRLPLHNFDVFPGGFACHGLPLMSLLVVLLLAF